MRRSMQDHGGGLLDQIEQDVLDEGKPLSAALRRCTRLGGRHGSSQLRVGDPRTQGLPETR